MKTKQASILLEVVFSIAILSIVVINAMLIYKEFFEINHSEFNQELHKLELLNTKYFLEKNIQTLNDVNKLSYTHTKLYFNHHLLLQNITSYELKHASHNVTISLCLNEQICKNWVFLL